MIQLIRITLLAVASAELPIETDWIIVGGGAAGCTAAAALADGNEKVLLIERGRSDLEIPSTQSGLDWAKVVEEASEGIRWTEGAWGAVATVLGGGASINDGYFFEESPYHLKKLMQFDDQDLQAFYASSKYLADSLLTPLPPTGYGSAWAHAIEASGFGGDFDPSEQHNIRYKNGTWVVGSLFNLSSPTWTRNTPAVLIHQRAGMQNLQVALNTHVHRIQFDGVRASGVWAGVGNKKQLVKANKGIIVSTGAIYTPQLLQHSGVGDAETLSKLNVSQVIDLPGVGKNFVDRLTWSVEFLSSHTQDHFLGYTVTGNGEMGLTFESVGGRGVDKYMAGPSAGLAPVKERVPELIPFMKFLMKDTPVGALVDHATSGVVLLQDTHSRGVIIANKELDATKPPIVSANYFGDPRDEVEFLKGLKSLVKIIQQDVLNPYKTKKAFEPINSTSLGLTESHIDLLHTHGIDVDERGIPFFLHCLFEEPHEAAKFIALPCLPRDESTWGQWLKDNVLSTYHYFGTAAVGSVVERGSFKVKGSESLYVVDASVIPGTPRINPVGTIMSLGHFIGTKLAKAGKPSVNQLFI